jgi:hypothetical protein
MVQVAPFKVRLDKHLSGFVRFLSTPEAGMVLFLQKNRRELYDTLLLIISKIVKPKKGTNEKAHIFCRYFASRLDVTGL